jgi:hypothetical protein
LGPDSAMGAAPQPSIDKSGDGDGDGDGDTDGVLTLAAFWVGAGNALRATVVDAAPVGFGPLFCAATPDVLNTMEFSLPLLSTIMKLVFPCVATWSVKNDRTRSHCLMRSMGCSFRRFHLMRLAMRRFGAWSPQMPSLG